jgi:hypothetical protein
MDRLRLPVILIAALALVLTCFGCGGSSSGTRHSDDGQASNEDNSDGKDSFTPLPAVPLKDQALVAIPESKNAVPMLTLSGISYNLMLPQPYDGQPVPLAVVYSRSELPMSLIPGIVETKQAFSSVEYAVAVIKCMDIMNTKDVIIHAMENVNVCTDVIYLFDVLDRENTNGTAFSRPVKIILEP